MRFRNRRNRNDTIRAAYISGIFCIVGAIIGAVISNYNGEKDIIKQIISQIGGEATASIDNVEGLINKYNELNSEKLLLKVENGAFKAGNEALKVENKALKDDILKLKNNSVSGNNEKIVSIIYLNALENDRHWWSQRSSYSPKKGFIDIGGKEYLSGFHGSHSVKNNKNEAPTYILDSNYRKCQGQIVWTKEYEESDGSAWIEFYSGDYLIYTTEGVNKTDYVIEFEFSVEGLDTITVLRKCTRENVQVLYSYLNFIE